MRPIHLLLASLALSASATTACGTGSSAATADSTSRDSLTRRQKDSIIGQSAIPGARGVAGALRVADSGAAHQVAVDSAAREP